MAVTVGVARPPVGGGFGDRKTQVLELSGTYVTGGFAVGGLTADPLFMACNAGYGVTFVGGKIKLSGAGGLTGASVTIGNTDLVGSVAIGAVDVAGPTAAYTVPEGGVIPAGAIVSENGAAVAVAITGGTFDVTGTIGAAGELASGSDLTGVKIAIIF